ncbi:MAG: Txe/YoeB family addiction module toxin [Prevotellaceae bacterium]|jgi:toxin YoeB|nr:Txe/YoeB family addiction module toxin [Prevotellaceae bacterium]
MYTLEFSKKALNDLAKLKRNEPTAFRKAGQLLRELKEHPKTVTGKPKPLADRAGEWSRRITQKHRLIYRIEETTVCVLVLSSYGHYEDK